MTTTDSRDGGSGTTVRPAPSQAEISAAVAELTGGTVTEVTRLPRWRPSWNVDVMRDGETLPLYVRGEREERYVDAFGLLHELAVHELLEEAGVPVPHVHAYLANLEALVMDRAPGVQGLVFADEADRGHLLAEAISNMVAMHRVDLSKVAARGIEVPGDPEQVRLSAAFRAVEETYLRNKATPDPVVEFLRLWVRRNQPLHRTEAAFIAFDAAQFLHHDGKLTALIDFELAHVGDPYMDLAALRLRDTMEPLGDLAVAWQTYETLTDRPIDRDALRYYEIQYATVSPMGWSAAIADPVPGSDLVTTMIWYIDNARYGLEVLAELRGIELETLVPPAPRRSLHSARHRALVAALKEGSGKGSPIAGSAPGQGFDEYRARCVYRTARHLARIDEIGEELTAADLDETARLVGRAVTDPVDADSALEAFVREASPAEEARLVHVLHRRMQRAHMLLGPADSLVVRHPALQPL